MELQDGGVYRSPQGGLFKAQLEYRRYASEPAWVLIPIDLESGHSWRDSLEQLLFLEEGRIGYFDFTGPRPNFVDTGWSTDDFRMETNKPAGARRG